MQTRRYVRRKKAYRSKRKTRTQSVARIAKRVFDRNTENKWRQIANSPIIVGYNGPPDRLLLNALVIGSTREQRIGNKVTLQDCQMFLNITAQFNLCSRLRVLVFYDKQTNGALGTFNVYDLFAGLGALDTFSMMTPLNPDLFPTRFVKLIDKIVTVTVNGGANDVAQEKTIRLYPKVKGKVMQFNGGSAGTVADINKGALWCVCVSDEITTAQPAVNIRTLLRFKDD